MPMATNEILAEMSGPGKRFAALQRSAIAVFKGVLKGNRPTTLVKQAETTEIAVVTVGDFLEEAKRAGLDIGLGEEETYERVIYPFVSSRLSGA